MTDSAGIHVAVASKLKGSDHSELSSSQLSALVGNVIFTRHTYYRASLCIRIRKFDKIFISQLSDYFYAPPPPSKKMGILFCTCRSVGLSVGRSVRPPNGFRMITQERLGLGS